MECFASTGGRQSRLTTSLTRRNATPSPPSLQVEPRLLTRALVWLDRQSRSVLKFGLPLEDTLYIAPAWTLFLFTSSACISSREACEGAFLHTTPPRYFPSTKPFSLGYKLLLVFPVFLSLCLFTHTVKITASGFDSASGPVIRGATPVLPRWTTRNYEPLL